MPLLINDQSINQAQLNEIYCSAVNSRKLGEAMSIPSYVIDEVRRQIRDEGLRYIKPETTAVKTVPFNTNTKRAETMHTPNQQIKPISLDNTTKYLLAFSGAKALLLLKDIRQTLSVDKDECRATIENLLKEGLIHQVLNGKYTISKKGITTLKPNAGQLCKGAEKRSVFYSQHPEKLRHTLPAAKALPLESSKPNNQKPTAQPAPEVSQMFDELLAEPNKSVDKQLALIDIELAEFNSRLTLKLSNVSTKIKIIQSLGKHFDGAVACHLQEIEQFLSSQVMQ